MMKASVEVRLLSKLKIDTNYALKHNLVVLQYFIKNHLDNRRHKIAK